MNNIAPFSSLKGDFQNMDKRIQNILRNIFFCVLQQKESHMSLQKQNFYFFERTIPLRGRPSVDFITTRCLSETSPWGFWGDKVFGGFLFMGFLVN